MRFKVGDRVRILCMAEPEIALKPATIIGIGKWNERDSMGPLDSVGETCYLVCVDGVGTGEDFDFEGWAYSAHDLAPLTPPHQEQWEAFKTQYLVPDKRIKVTA